MQKPLIIPTAEPFFFPGGNTGCLVVHGHTGTPKEMGWLGEFLHKHGYTVLGIRLFGHATRPDDMLRARWWDWLADIENGINLLRNSAKKIYIMGLSMGAMLALISAARYPLDGVVAISAPFDLPPDPRLKIIRFLAPFYPRVHKGGSDFHDKEAEKDHIDYPYFPTRSVIQVQALLKVMKESLPQIKIPVFLVQSHGDRVIPAYSMDRIYEQLGTSRKEKLWVEDSGHVVVREPERERVFAAIDHFIKVTS